VRFENADEIIGRNDVFRGGRETMAYKGKRRELDQQQAEAPGVDWLVVGLSAAGFLVAGYLTWLKWAGRGALLCVAGSGCDLVQASRYSMFLGVPTAFWGAALYAAIGILGGLGLTVRRWIAAFLMAAAGVGFSLYLTALSLIVVGGACVYCLVSAAIEVAMLIALLWRRPPARSRRSFLRPVPLASYSTLAAAATIAFGAFVFAAPSSAPAGYQSALALHLRQTGAIMYGAFW
jgi:uncharacterized membrane protein